ncbi:MAG TPA: hypothetical protein VGK33_01585 [Chloroflexota bacterium]|jgi:hypothetical protein
MAVRALATGTVDTAYQPAGGIPPIALAVVLVPAALDLLAAVMPALAQTLLMPGAVASGAAAAVMLLAWLRFPRASWLAAAMFAAAISAVLRLNGDQVAWLVSLLSIVALGIGGGFASGDLSPVEAD